MNTVTHKCINSFTPLRPAFWVSHCGEHCLNDMYIINNSVLFLHS